jgi:hypothetical protein
MIILLRGHVRASFNDNRLYSFVKHLCRTYKDVEIYIHTWNILQNNISWRKVASKEITITKNIIHKYFRDCSKYIKNIIIDDDKLITLNGNLDGKIAGSLCPLIGWKNYWYGQYQIINHINNLNTYSKNNLMVNIRFDVFTNPHGFSERDILTFINKHYNTVSSEIKFIYNEFFLGCDNCFIGNTETMYKLIHHFHFNLDDILSKFKIIKHQEGLVMIENYILFNSSNKININDVVNYGNKHHKLKTFQFINNKMQKII